MPRGVRRASLHVRSLLDTPHLGAGRETAYELAESALLAGEQSVEILEVTSGVVRYESLTTALGSIDDRSAPEDTTT
jgi:hypothetical protein